MKRPKKLTDHHTLPRSRGGDSRPLNILEVDESLHRAWHFLFSNLTVPEIHEFIEAVWANGGSYQQKFDKWAKTRNRR